MDYPTGNEQAMGVATRILQDLSPEAQLTLNLSLLCLPLVWKIPRFCSWRWSLGSFSGTTLVPKSREM